MDLDLRGARVLVTGGASNIGRGIVHGFAAEGARLLICDVDGEQAAKVQAEALERGATAAEVVEQDLTHEGAGARVVGELIDRWGGIDALVNNAGWSVPGFFTEDTDRARWQKLVEINVFAAIDCTQAAITPMREAGQGSIVFIASDAAFGEIRQGVYGATKASLLALARTVAKEHGRHGIRSNVVCPGLVVPEGKDAVGPKSLWAADPEAVFNEKQIEAMTKGIPLRRLTTADDIANAVVWVSSERTARQVTGQVFSVSGGYSMP
ncbi:SDR family oxidoreductase [Amycolatopsis acidicola]|uniref:SDR family oxidoreductase n=2 Tax=Amycolatopsis acidicola TaxID=2596893 RepID=A0A5N0VMZ6_9PSEU|nr:SDR family oxidoreductase [Amycolatopsis acidicola]